ncbi:pyridoxal-dependent decarboxylase domain protein [Diplodia corticola]|uniref:Pyridoxal-dependent decarboxylase domain protein n=1 Tax=Diplodia corticola TaxID=236234 RepID=A0A1J9SJZ5_9PEZI|nr:pyridoxal-dependent decarboxylase domain protein [Diplodia corticola]OJD39925.1 pyridoxal-dependent decarboxylase domain protein [Diplodia corticola]
MSKINLGGVTFGGGLNAPSLGKANTTGGISVPRVGSISANAGIDASKGLRGITGGVELKKDNGNVFTSGGSKKSVEDKSHQAISSYFIGPRAENLAFFKDNMNVILEHFEKGRLDYFPNDGEFISDQIQASETFQERTASVAKAVQSLSHLMSTTSIPFFSPRYQAHMATDMSMPALLGYFMTMLYNPNNVAFEASPITTIVEMQVGEQLCDMLGYNVLEPNIPTAKSSQPVGWGHVTWSVSSATMRKRRPRADVMDYSARNIKYYPLAIRQALDGPLGLVKDTFTVKTAQNVEKLFSDLTTWELLNLKSETILDIPDRLNRDYSISSKYIEQILDDYGIQSRGKEALDRHFGIEKPAQYMLSNTRHYSWPKGGAITGIGSENIVGIPVDYGARINLDELEKRLEENLKKEQAVYAVTAIIGSTEEGAVDPLGKILTLRRRFQARGLSFLVHADAAWGGYFTSMLPRDYTPGSGFMGNLPVGLGEAEGFVPDSSLRTDTQEDLWWLRQADSITLDPHKSGYIPYPAGGLAYRDGRMRYLVTWTTPYLSQGSTSSIGIYGLEGSKPGASAVSTFMANKCIGLNPEGYGALLGEVTYSCSRLSAQWAAMTDDKMDFVVVPFNMLPSELAPDATPESIEAEKQWIRDNILSSSNLNIVTNNNTSPGGDTALSLLRKLGSDLNINAFAVNFRNSDGLLNTDTREANYLMRRVVENFSVDSPGDDPTKIPLYLTSTEFSPKLYGDCARKFKERLGLRDDKEDLFVLRNVVMSPFPTEKDFITELTNIFKKVVEEEVMVSRERNESTEASHEFLVQGEDPIYFVHKPSFHAANRRRQTIFEVELPKGTKEDYQTLQSQYPEEIVTFYTTRDVDLTQAINEPGELIGYLDSDKTRPMLPAVKVKVKRKWLDRPLTGPSLAADYPSGRMPFYLYGDFDASDPSQVHVDHALLRYPNIQLTAPNINLTFPTPPQKRDASRNGTPLLLFLDDIREETMQPFPESNATLASLPNFFFQEGKDFAVSVWEDPAAGSQDGQEVLEAWEKLGLDGGDESLLVGRGTMTLGPGAFVDAECLNVDPYKRVDPVGAWVKELDKIGSL